MMVTQKQNLLIENTKRQNTQRLMQQTVPLHCSRSVFDLCIVRLVGCRTLLNCSTTISVLMRTCESQHSVTIVDQLLVWRLHVEIYVDS